MTYEQSSSFVYWTGGYDSTFVLLDALHSGKTVQPVYLENCDARKSTDIEVYIMNKIRKYLPRNLTKNLLPTIYIDCRQVRLDADVQAGMWELYITKKLRRPKSQYSYLAQVPRLLQTYISAGSELGPGTSISQHVREHVDKHGYLTDTSPWYLQIFSQVKFPVVRITKQRMMAIARKKGFLCFLKMTWTCRVPIRVGDEIFPCGRCELCRERIIEHP